MDFLYFKMPWRIIGGMALLGSGWFGAPGQVTAAPAPPEPPARSAIEAALENSLQTNHPQQDQSLVLPRKLRLVLLADKKDHGPHEHDYPLWQRRWALLLGGPEASRAKQVNLFGPAQGDPDSEKNRGRTQVEITRAQGWPTKEMFASADVIVAFCYLSWNDDKKDQVKQYLHRGGGLVLIHSATWTKPGPDPEVAKLTGIGGFSRFRHGPVQLDLTAPDHPICQGLPRKLNFLDETYWPPTPGIDRSRVTVLAVSREQSGSNQHHQVPQPIFWTYRSGPGRVFGCVLGHYTWTFDDPWFRILLLRGIAWSANTSPSLFDHLVLRGARVANK